jgi:hypothetical protein
LYEIKDYYTSYTRFFQNQKREMSPVWLIFFSGNSYYNSIGDQVSAALGYVLGFYLFRYGYLVPKNIAHIAVLLAMLFLGLMSLAERLRKKSLDRATVAP